MRRKKNNRRKKKKKKNKQKKKKKKKKKLKQRRSGPRHNLISLIASRRSDLVLNARTHKKKRGTGAVLDKKKMEERKRNQERGVLLNKIPKKLPHQRNHHTEKTASRHKFLLGSIWEKRNSELHYAEGRKERVFKREIVRANFGVFAHERKMGAACLADERAERERALGSKKDRGGGKMQWGSRRRGG